MAKSVSLAKSQVEHLVVGAASLESIDFLVPLYIQSLRLDLSSKVFVTQFRPTPESAEREVFSNSYTIPKLDFFLGQSGHARRKYLNIKVAQNWKREFFVSNYKYLKSIGANKSAQACRRNYFCAPRSVLPTKQNCFEKAASVLDELYRLLGVEASVKILDEDIDFIFTHDEGDWAYFRPISVSLNVLFRVNADGSNESIFKSSLPLCRINVNKELYKFRRVCFKNNGYVGIPRKAIRPDLKFGMRCKFRFFREMAAIHLSAHGKLGHVPWYVMERDKIDGPHMAIPAVCLVDPKFKKQWRHRLSPCGSSIDEIKHQNTIEFIQKALHQQEFLGHFLPFQHIAIRYAVAYSFDSSECIGEVTRLRFIVEKYYRQRLKKIPCKVFDKSEKMSIWLAIHNLASWTQLLNEWRRHNHPQSCHAGTTGRNSTKVETIICQITSYINFIRKELSSQFLFKGYAGGIFNGKLLKTKNTFQNDCIYYQTHLIRKQSNAVLESSIQLFLFLNQTLLKPDLFLLSSILPFSELVPVVKQLTVRRLRRLESTRIVV